MKSLTALLTFCFLVFFLIPSSVSAAATMNDYWQGKAQWKLVNKLTIGNTGWAYGFGAGAHINIVGNNWYLFGRKLWAKQNPACPDSAGTEVRKSTDGGFTWSAPADIITPAPGTPWECAGTDGDAYYNASENKWHYLFQCLAPGGAWNGCEAERSGDPMGPFQQTHANPVINGANKDLWRNICTDGSKDCFNISGGNNVFDAGTFNIFDYSGGYYYVGFHGFDGAHGEHGYRGIAKTPDFINWTAGGQGVPADAVLDKYNQSGFRESWQGEPKGFAAGSILKEGGYYYFVSESFDLSLLCVDGQNWDWGMFRSSSLSSANWEALPQGNPFLYSSKKPERNGKSIACNPAYVRLFRDASTSKIYMHKTLESMDSNNRGIFIYELATSSNLLQNADLWKCTKDNWYANSPQGSSTNMTVYRYPNESSDGNCFLSASCGAASCVPAQSFYQDADVTNIPYRNLSYGGKFATTSGTGDLILTLYEFDQAGNMVKDYRTNLTATTNYQTARNQITLANETKRVRFEVYLQTPSSFKADEMFVDPIAQFSSPTPEPSIPGPLPKNETCSVSAPSTVNPGQSFNISFSAFADDNTPRTENLWIERSDGGPIDPAPGTLVQGGGLNYYKLTTCTSSTQPCTGSAAVSLPPGSYITHCDSNGKNKCSGNPFCDYNGGTVNCSLTGWRECSANDSQTITVAGATPAPQVTSVVFNGGSDAQAARTLDLSGVITTPVTLTNHIGNNIYSASVDAAYTTGAGDQIIRRLTINFIYQPTPSPTPGGGEFEVGLEAGEQHDTSRVGLVDESGANWVRLNFVGNDWSAYSNDVNTYNSIIDAYLSRNIKVIGLIGAQSVSGGYNRNNPGDFTQKFTDVSEAIISRFGDRVKVFELFNEPNDWKGGNTAQVTQRYFAEYLASIYRKVKIEGGKTDITLNSGPLYSHDTESGANYLQETFNQGRSLNGNLNWETIKSQTGSYPLDGVGYHIYVSQGMGDQGQVESKVSGNISAIESVIASYDPGKRIWITEIGWGTGTDRVTEDVQAQNLVKVYSVLRNHPSIRLGMWFTLIDFDVLKWGLVRGDETKKPAWFKFQELNNVSPTQTPSSTATAIPTITPGPSLCEYPPPPFGCRYVNPRLVPPCNDELECGSPNPSATSSPRPTATATPRPTAAGSTIPGPSSSGSPFPSPSAPIVSSSPGTSPAASPTQISQATPTSVSQTQEVKTILLGSQPVDPSGQSPLTLRLTGQNGKPSTIVLPVSLSYNQGNNRSMSIQFNYTGSAGGQGGSVGSTLAEKKYDLNNDKVINSVDVTTFFSGWRSKARGGVITMEDFNRDGVINSFDYALLKNQLGKKVS